MEDILEVPPKLTVEVPSGLTVLVVQKDSCAPCPQQHCLQQPGRAATEVSTDRGVDKEDVGVCTYTRVCARIYTCVHTHVYVCVHIHVCAYMRAHTHTVKYYSAMKRMKSCSLQQHVWT